MNSFSVSMGEESSTKQFRKYANSTILEQVLVVICVFSALSLVISAITVFHLITGLIFKRSNSGTSLLMWIVICIISFTIFTITTMLGAEDYTLMIEGSSLYYSTDSSISQPEQLHIPCKLTQKFYCIILKEQDKKITICCYSKAEKRALLKFLEGSVNL